jgi:SAM-dependent methyltransferase
MSSFPERPRAFGRWRRALLGTLTGRVLEVGCGSGANFAHYPAAARVTAFDAHLGRARTAARRAEWRRAWGGAPVRVLVADAHALPWAGGSFDAVVGTLVFCSIPDPAAALAEIRRVLVPGGRLYLIEHVRSDRPLLGRAMDAVAPAWHCVTGGCHLNRDTEAAVRAAGFTLQRVRPAYAGVLKLMQAVRGDRLTGGSPANLKEPAQSA